MYKRRLIFIAFAVALFLIQACHKQYKSEVRGRLLHPNQSPVGSQGLVLRGDNIFGKDNSRYLTDATQGGINTDGKGEFRLFVKTPRNGKCYLNAIQQDGSLMQIAEVFYLKEGDVIELGDITVTW